MPQPPKYTVEQRMAVYDLYWEDREDPMPGIRSTGKYTLKQIEAMTGVKAETAWKIARLLR